MKKIICCKQNMELKSTTGRLSSVDLFFQCKKCGKVCMKRIDEYDEDYQLNEKLT